MTVDEDGVQESVQDRVRTLLQGTGVPRSRLDAVALLADSRRSRRRRRIARVAGAALAVVAVAVPAAVVLADRAPRPDRPDRTATAVATTTTVEHRRTTLGATARCTPTKFALPGTFTWEQEVRTDPSGRYVLKTNYQMTVPYMWTDGAIAQLSTGPDFYPVAATPDGVVFGHVVREPGGSYRYHDGELTALPAPDGYRDAVVSAANARGDALGTAFTVGPEPRTTRALVVWPADRPDRPRVIEGNGLGPVAILDDGTVLALDRTPENGPLRPIAMLVVAPDGTRTRIDLTGDLAGFSAELDGTAVRGDFLYGHYTTTHWPDLHPVRWNLRTGRVEIFDDLFIWQAGNAAGWFTAADRNMGDAPAVVVGPDGSARTASADQHVAWIGPTGSDMIGSDGLGGDLVTWRCT